MKKLVLILCCLTLVNSPVVSATGVDEEQRRVLDSGAYYFNVEETALCNSLPIVNGGVDRFLQVLAYQESRGNPTAQNSESSASGKYQYIDSTWRSRTALYGPAGQYSRAKDAPEAVQDAVAYIEYTQKFNELGNDLFKLALSHFLPAAIENESLLDVVPPRNSITPRQYADKLIESIGTGLGSDIPLLYSQAPEFDTWLSKVGGAPPNINTSSAGGSCGGLASASTIVNILQKELDGKAKQSDGSYLKYTDGVEAAWCAYFASWVLKEAGMPFEGGTIPTASGIMAYGQERNAFYEKGDPNFTPQPGDMVIYKEGLMPYPSHVNFVISYDPSGNKITTIGGNESDTILQATWDADMAAITGYVRLTQ